MSVLDELAADARRRARFLPLQEPTVKPWGLRFDDALRGKERLKVVAEFKQASPTLGTIAELEVATQVRRYVEAGASAVSVLTEPTRFRGSLEHLEQAARTVDVPVLMKDFVVDPAQIRAGACRGARAVLLIARCLSASDLAELTSACEHYGLVPMIECHDEREVLRALDIADAVIGVNNRDLETLEVDPQVALRLLREIPAHRVVVAESGYHEAAATRELRGIADAVLVGTALMKRTDPAEFIREVIG